MTERISLLSVGLATCVLALGFGLAALWTWTVLVLALGALWLFGQWRGWGWPASVGLAGYTGVAAAGLLMDLRAGWMLCALVAALTAWDLDRFVRRLKGAQRVERARSLERRHLLRLLILDGLSLLLAAVALGIQVEFGFATALLLGLLAILGLGQVVTFLKREVS